MKKRRCTCAWSGKEFCSIHYGSATATKETRAKQKPKAFVPADYLERDELAIFAACAANPNVGMAEMITMGEMFKKIARDRYDHKYRDEPLGTQLSLL
jgi:hypothetical protein